LFLAIAKQKESHHDTYSLFLVVCLGMKLYSPIIFRLKQRKECRVETRNKYLNLRHFMFPGSHHSSNKPVTLCLSTAMDMAVPCLVYLYRGADKSLARPWKETSYSDQDLQHYTKTYGVKITAIYCCCFTP